MSDIGGESPLVSKQAFLFRSRLYLGKNQKGCGKKKRYDQGHSPVTLRLLVFFPWAVFTVTPHSYPPSCCRVVLAMRRDTSMLVSQEGEANEYPGSACKIPLKSNTGSSTPIFVHDSQVILGSFTSSEMLMLHPSTVVCPYCAFTSGMQCRVIKAGKEELVF